MFNIQGVMDNRERDVPSIAVSEHVSTVVHLFSENNYSAAVIVDDQNHPCGIVTEHDLVRAMGESGHDSVKTPVGEIMSMDIIVVTPETSIEEAMKMMSDYKIQYLPVVSESGHLLGFVSVMEVMTFYLSAID